MGEGFGDYLAAAYSTETAGPTAEWTPCVMEWDATSYDDGYPDRRASACGVPTTTEHRRSSSEPCGTAQGEQSTASARSGRAPSRPARSSSATTAGRSVADRLVLESHFLLPENPSFEEAAGAILDADDALYGGTHYGAATRSRTAASASSWPPR